MTSRSFPWRSVTAIVLLAGAVVTLQVVHERNGGPPAATSETLLYLRSPDTMRRLALSYDSLLADVYWIRAVQYYGSMRLSPQVDKRYELLFPLLDVTTSLEPRFNMAYLFGSIYLAESPPGGPGRPDLAITLLEKGLRAQPEKWEFAQSIGFVHYWWRQDYEQAASWFSRAATIPNAPIWMAPLAATTLAEGGSRESSRLLWRQIADTAEHEWFRNEARRRLQQLDAMDQIDKLQAAVEALERRRGVSPSDWSDLRAAGYLRGTPADPTGVPYELERGFVRLGRGSRLFPLPDDPVRAK